MTIGPAIATLLIAVGLSRPLAAQSPACGRPATLSLAGGVAQHDHVDETASPFQFQGRGAELAAWGEQSLGRYCLTLDAQGGRTTLTTRQGTSALEQVIGADGGVALLRAIGGRTVRLAAGLALRGDLTTTSHDYTDPEHLVAVYRFGTIALGPALRADARVLGGWATLELSSPAVAIVDHPYTPVWPSAGAALRLVSPTQLRGVHAALVVAPLSWHDVTPVIAFRANALRYDDVHPVRTLTQTLTLGATLVLPRR